MHIAAQPETVFPYFTDPARYVQWMGTEATLEAVPGGRYRVRMRDGVEAAGEFLEVEPPRRLVFTWGWTGGHAGRPRQHPGRRHLRGGGRRHPRRPAPPRPARRRHSGAQHRMGWDLYLGRLGLVVLGQDPGRDPNA